MKNHIAPDSFIEELQLGTGNELAVSVTLSKEEIVSVLLRLEATEQALAEHIKLADERISGDYFQRKVKPWLIACFGWAAAFNKTERNHRFLEESLELVQSTGCTRSEAHQLVDYVFDRPVGEPVQELGGVMVTLAALAEAHDMQMFYCGERELHRCWTKVDKIRAKQATKPDHSPLPETVAAEKELRKDAQGNPIPWDKKHDYFMGFDPANPDIPTD